MNLDDLEIDEDALLNDPDLLLEAMQMDLEPSLQNILDQKELKWIFLGGKGGVGKSTSSCALSIQLAKVRKSVLLLSTDPAHNLSDAFCQKFNGEPTLVKGFDNLYAMEIEPKAMKDTMLGGMDGFLKEQGSALGGLGGIKDLMSNVTSMPGMDEFSSFFEIMKQVKEMKFDCVVFDTAPTGHTLRLLAFPDMMEKGMGKIMNMKNMKGMLGQVSSMLGQDINTDQIQDRLSGTQNVIKEISLQFKNPKLTTFVCVCIPEFLSVYETERLVQELNNFGIDSHNVIVNQLVFEDPDRKEDCKLCKSRIRIQRKYLDQIFELYDTFHVVQMPLWTEEVRGAEMLKKFSENLIKPLTYAYQKREEKK